MPLPTFKSSLSNGPDSCYPLVFLPDLFWKRIFVDYWSRFSWAGCSSCHPTNNVKVLRKLRAQTLVSENHSLASSLLELPMDSRGKGCCCLFSASAEKDTKLIIMAALHSRCGHYIFVLFLLSSTSFFFA